MLFGLDDTGTRDEEELAAADGNIADFEGMAHKII
jgi:hypothetical protein